MTNWIKYREENPGTPEEIVRRSQPPMVRAIIDNNLNEYLEKFRAPVKPVKRSFLKVLFGK